MHALVVTFLEREGGREREREREREGGGGDRQTDRAVSGHNGWSLTNVHLGQRESQVSSGHLQTLRLLPHTLEDKVHHCLHLLSDNVGLSLEFVASKR